MDKNSVEGEIARYTCHLGQPIIVFLALTAVIWLSLNWWISTWLVTNEVPADAMTLFNGITIRELLSNDKTGIIRAQISATVSIAILGLVQVKAGVLEIASTTRDKTSRFNSIITQIVGFPRSWLQGRNAGSEMDHAVREQFGHILYQHAETRLALFRYVTAGLPVLGFIGTVIGVRAAIAPMDTLGPGAENLVESLGQVVSGLEIAFDTTLSGLVTALVAGFIQLYLSYQIQRTHLILAQENKAFIEQSDSLPTK